MKDNLPTLHQVITLAAVASACMVALGPWAGPGAGDGAAEAFTCAGLVWAYVAWEWWARRHGR